MFAWLWKKAPEPTSLRDRVSELEDQAADLARQLRRVEKELEDQQEGVDRRFGRLNARLKPAKSEEPEGEGQPKNDVPGANSSAANDLREWRGRRFGGLLR